MEIEPAKSELLAEDQNNFEKTCVVKNMKFKSITEVKKLNWTTDWFLIAHTDQIFDKMGITFLSANLRPGSSEIEWKIDYKAISHGKCFRGATKESISGDNIRQKRKLPDGTEKEGFLKIKFDFFLFFMTLLPPQQ